MDLSRVGEERIGKEWVASEGGSGSGSGSGSDCDCDCDGDGKGKKWEKKGRIGLGWVGMGQSVVGRHEV